MGGFTGNDGSELIGGLNLSGVVQAISIDNFGRLIVSIGALPALPPGTNNIGTMGTAGAPVITEDQIRAYTMAGQAFSATTGKLAAPAAATLGFQLFNPANSGKSLLIYSLVVNYAGLTFHDFRITSADISSIAGWTNAAITPVNNKGGGAASIATSGSSNTNLTGGLLGNAREVIGVPSTQSIEALTNGECLYLPASASINGIAVYINATGANNWAITCEYLEF